MNETLNNKDFYDSLAGDYDEMISFNDAVERKVNTLRKFISPSMKTAADIGCGTGVDSIALAKLGLNVTAFDPSDVMIRVAEDNAEREGVKIDFQNCAADEIQKRFNNSFDLVISLGNTFANIERDKFDQSIRKCSNILKPEGSILIQILNYKKILYEKERIVNITEKNGNYYVRFYDFINGEIHFNL
jgi:2-polyprenyl-3-methyl-5-hydroxy-6-metoxy-1,4-benzoquinol methylase